MKKLSIFSAVTILAAAATSAMTGCEAAKNAAGAEQCGLKCPVTGVAEGNANISGVPNIDGFFDAVVNYNATANVVVDGLTAPMTRIKARLGLSADKTGADVVAAVKAQYGITGSFKVAYAPPKCQVSAQATVEAAAKCDATVKPATATMKCEGRCEADVTVKGGKVGCDVDADVHCSAPSISAACTGSCKGACTLTAEAACSGTCQGTCTGTCDVKDASGNCAGKCDGTCKGTCQMNAGGTCSGTCDGDCAVQATGGSCDASAKVECFAEPPSGEANVQCNAKCEGGVTPPEVKAECQGSVKANAELKAECTPPTVDIVMDAGATATVNATAYAAFEESFRADIGAMVAGLQRADIALRAGATISASAEGVATAFNKYLEDPSKLDLKVSVGLGCAVDELPKVAATLTTATTGLTNSVTAAGSFVAAFK